MRKFAVIVAGGSGSRMGTEIPKQFLLVNDAPVLVHTLRAFVKAYPDLNLVIVLPSDHMEKGRQVIREFLPSAKAEFVVGGNTRFESVKNGLSKVDGDSIVFVHDAVRCLVSSSLIQRCYENALAKGSAIPVVPLKDSIRRLTAGGSEVLNRDELRAVQTPQTFIAKTLKAAFNTAYNVAFTDEATVVEYNGGSVELIEGEDFNIKITYPSDLLLAEQYFSKGKLIS